MKPVRLEQRAVADLDQALAWYAERDAGVARHFLAEVKERLQQLEHTPGLGPPWPGLAGMRRLTLRGFPFWIAYEELDAAITVWAVPHHRQRPGAWRP